MRTAQAYRKVKFFAFSSMALVAACRSTPTTFTVKGVDLSALKNAEIRSAKSYELGNRLVDETTLMNGGEFFVVKIIHDADTATARGYVNQNIFMIESLFNEHKSAYPGAISSAITCPKPLLPVLAPEGGGTSLVVKLFANGRQAYGVCDSTQVKFRSLIVVRHCEKRKLLVELKAFLPHEPENPAREKELLALNCSD
jgi:hypothetical protein